MTEMEVLNDQLHKEIQIYKDKMLLKMISVDSMENFYETVIKSETNKEHILQSTTTQDDSGSICYNEETSGTWNQLESNLRESLELLKKANAEYDFENELQNKLQNDIANERSKMIQRSHGGGTMGEPLGPSELNELVLLWENELNDMDIESKSDGIQKTAQDPIQIEPSVNTEEPQPLNMGLFYGRSVDPNVQP